MNKKQYEMHLAQLTYIRDKTIARAREESKYMLAYAIEQIYKAYEQQTHKIYLEYTAPVLVHVKYGMVLFG